MSTYWIHRVTKRLQGKDHRSTWPFRICQYIIDVSLLKLQSTKNTIRKGNNKEGMVFTEFALIHFHIFFSQVFINTYGKIRFKKPCCNETTSIPFSFKRSGRGGSSWSNDLSINPVKKNIFFWKALFTIHGFFYFDFDQGCSRCGFQAGK